MTAAVRDENLRLRLRAASGTGAAWRHTPYRVLFGDPAQFTIPAGELDLLIAPWPGELRPVNLDALLGPRGARSTMGPSMLMPGDVRRCARDLRERQVKPVATVRALHLRLLTSAGPSVDPVTVCEPHAVVEIDCPQLSPLRLAVHASDLDLPEAARIAGLRVSEQRWLAE